MKTIDSLDELWTEMVDRMNLSLKEGEDIFVAGEEIKYLGTKKRYDPEIDEFRENNYFVLKNNLTYEVTELNEVTGEGIILKYPIDSSDQEYQEVDKKWKELTN